MCCEYTFSVPVRAGLGGVNTLASRDSPTDGKFEVVCCYTRDVSQGQIDTDTGREIEGEPGGNRQMSTCSSRLLFSHRGDRHFPLDLHPSHFRHGGHVSSQVSCLNAALNSSYYRGRRKACAKNQLRGFLWTTKKLLLYCSKATNLLPVNENISHVCRVAR